VVEMIRRNNKDS